MDYLDLYNWTTNKSVLPVSSLPDVQFVSYKQFEDNNKFRIAIPTRRLIELVKSRIVVHVDSTYKVMYNGYPLTVIGVTDLHRSLHPFMYCNTTGEETEDYEFAQKGVDVASQMVNGEKNSFQFLMADCAKAISVVKVTVYGDRVKRLFCWYHVIASIRKRKELIKNKEQKDEIDSQIASIQLLKWSLSMLLICLYLHGAEIVAK